MSTLGELKLQIYIPQYKKFVVPFEDCQPISITEINKIPLSACLLIHLGNTHEFVTNIDELLQVSISKLRHNGDIIVEGTDIYESTYSLINGTLSLEQTQSILFSGRLRCIGIGEIQEKIQSYNLTIIKSTLSQHKYFIRAKYEKS